MEIILKFWAEEHVALSFGENHIELCDYDEENCPFPGYCNTCKEVAEQMKFDEEQSSQVGSDIDIDVNNLLPGSGRRLGRKSALPDDSERSAE